MVTRVAVAEEQAEEETGMAVAAEWHAWQQGQR